MLKESLPLSRYVTAIRESGRTTAENVYAEVGARVDFHIVCHFFPESKGNAVSFRNPKETDFFLTKPDITEVQNIQSSVMLCPTQVLHDRAAHERDRAV